MITLLGSTGYVGQAFQKALQKQQIDFHALSRAQVDYTNLATLSAYLKESKPDFLINCAGYTGKPNVDACEVDKANCLSGNAQLPGILNEACAIAGIRWGHVSSGCIFAGRRFDGEGFRETDVPNFSFRHGPCSWYSGTKALGEEVLGYHETVDETGNLIWQHTSEPSAYIWRLRIPYDNVDSPRNYLSKLISYKSLLEAENSISHLGDFANACIACYTKQVPLGIYNVTNPGAITTKQVVELIRKSGVSNKEFTFFESDHEFYQKAASTPRSNCVMDSSKLESVGIKMRPVVEAVEASLRKWKTSEVV